MNKQQKTEQFIEGKLARGATQKAFDEIARYLLTQCRLRIGEKSFYLTEIEFYCHEENGWADTSIYKHKKQMEMGLFYPHVSGVDFTFGNGKDRHGGILIRGIAGENESAELACQPTKVKAKLSALEPDPEKWSEKIALEETERERTCVIFQGPRVNIKNDFRPLRYATDLNRPQKQILLLSSLLLGILDKQADACKELPGDYALWWNTYQAVKASKK